ncbi:MAG: type II secretion system inner membrane protein GspF [Armatimonadetes bacterium]|nr:type II secretion system inner membrane protein GspF [Armatimonadota bacterium]
MPVYTYSAIDSSGAEVSGVLNAGDEQAALGQVRERGLHPLGVRAQSGGGGAETADDSGIRRRGGRVRAADLTLFTRQLANLVKGGLPMMRTLDALIDNTENARLYALLQKVRQEVAEGESLHEALAKHPRVFNNLYLSLVRAGESSGELPTVLSRLADFQEQDLERRAQIRAALTYPILLMVVGTGIVTFLVTFLIPRFQSLFAEFGRALPVPTQIVLAVSKFFTHEWWVIILGVFLVSWAKRQWLASPRGRLTWDRWRLHWPLLGRLYQRAATARLARTLSTLLHGGVSILDALEILEGVVDNAALAESLREIRAGVREGESLGLRTRASGQFPGLLSQMMLVGEETGDVEGALSTVADAFDVEVNNALKGLVALVEPLIILVMGGIVGFVVFAMLMPIFQLNQSIG